VEISEERGVRYLHFGSHWIQGAMRLSRRDALELEYTRDMMFPLLLHPAHDWPASVLQIGLGAASITRFLHRHRPDAQLTVVEIEPRVVAIAQQHFDLPQTSRLRVELGDGAAYVTQRGPAFDLIVVDGFDARGLAGVLDTRAFYGRCRERLAAGGALVTNLLRRTRGCAPSVARLASAFDGRAMTLPVCSSGNTVALAATGAPLSASGVDLRAAARELRAQSGLDLARTVERVLAAGGGTGVSL
jgi:spermidine synthase